MSDQDQDRIRERAYALWEEEGRQAGRALDHWIQASKELKENCIGMIGVPQSSDVPEAFEQTDGPDKIPLYP